MKVHEIELSRDHCDEIYSEETTFVVEKNDRKYQKGDHISFIPVDEQYEQFCHPVSEKEYKITGIHYVIGPENNGINYVILDIKDITEDLNQRSILDRIRTDIMKLQTYKMFEGEDTVYNERDDVLSIIDKYKESEDSE